MPDDEDATVETHEVAGSDVAAVSDVLGDPSAADVADENAAIGEANEALGEQNAEVDRNTGDAELDADNAAMDETNAAIDAENAQTDLDNAAAAKADDETARDDLAEVIADTPEVQATNVGVDALTHGVNTASVTDQDALDDAVDAAARERERLADDEDAEFYDELPPGAVPDPTGRFGPVPAQEGLPPGA